MNYASELGKSLKKEFGWHKARIECLANLILALIKVRTVNLAELALAFTGTAKTTSHYIRLKRFFRHFSLDEDQIAIFIFKLFCFSKKCYLTLDRTQWEFGHKPINILLLAIVYQGIAIPIYWELLDKRGGVNHSEKVRLMERFICTFGHTDIAGILMDREFGNREWLAYLKEKKIPFYVRINRNYVIKDRNNQTKNAWQWFVDLKPGVKRLLGEVQILGQILNVAGMKLKNKDFLIIATDGNIDSALDIYHHRWEIETLFSCLKTRGFRFEETHITKSERIRKLIGVLALAFCWAHKVGEWCHEKIKPIVIKKHGYKSVSSFRHGLDKLRRLFLSNSIQKKKFYCFIRLLFGSQNLDASRMRLKYTPDFVP